jgi:hypothetical protein
MVQAFQVVSEFKFEVGGALLGTNQLQGAVEGLSGAVDQAVLSFQKMSLGLVAQFMTGPGGGILGILGAAISSSDEFTKSQINLANAMGTGAGTFAERMKIAEEKMMKMNQLATEFGLPGKSLVDMTKILLPAINTKMGGSGAIDTATDLSRNFLKSAPTLGIDPSDATGQLQRAVLGFTDMGDTLFRVLTADTKSMNEFVGNAKKFNALPMAQRVQKLTEAFGQFSKDTGALTARINTASGQLDILKGQLSGIFSVMRPLGEIVIPLVVDALKRVNDLIKNSFTKIIDHLTFAIKPFVGDLERFLATMLQLRELRKNLDFAKDVFQISGVLLLLRAAMTFFGVTLASLLAPLGGVAALLSGIVAIAMRALVFLWPFVAALAAVAVQMLMLSGLILLVSQIFERAAAIVKIRLAPVFADWAVKLAEIGETFMRIMGVFDDGVQVLAELLAISPIVDFVVKGITSAIDLLGWLVTKIGQAIMGFQGIFFAIMQFLEEVTSFFGGKGFKAGKIGEAFDAGTEDMFNKIFARPQKEGGMTAANTVVNMDVKMQNNFKEMMEPDRVAFTIKDQLLKASQNKTTAARRPFNVTAGAGAN